MINPTGKKLEKLLFGIFDDVIQGADRYNHNGSLWLIFTDEMRWVVEYTKSQTLWYNYHFFKQETEMVGLDCVDNKDLIQKWFESRFLGIPKVEDAFDPFFDQNQYVEDVIQNGVKQTELSKRDFFPKDIIKNGVKETISTLRRTAKWGVDDIIQNGIKDTKSMCGKRGGRVGNTIQNGVKNLGAVDYDNLKHVEGIIRIGEKIS